MVSRATQQVRRLVEHRNGHPVVSLYLDLDPERFATPPARASEIRSLIDQARRDIEADEALEHDDRQALREDLVRVAEFLRSPDAPFKGARALAVFCSTPDGLFESIRLTRPVPGRVIIGRHPYVEPMLAVFQQRRWLVALVNRRSAWLWAGSPSRLAEQGHVRDNVHGQHDQGGWSQSRYERSVEKEVDDHLRQFAGDVERRWRSERFDRLAVGGPQEIVPRFLEFLGEDVRGHLTPARVDVDLSEVSEATVREAIERVVSEDEPRVERELLDRLAEGVGGGRATTGLQDTVDALNERRVAHLLLEPGVDARASRCPTCGQLVLEGDGRCPSDGSPLNEVEHVREAVVEAALVQDAEVTVVRHHEDLRSAGGIGALLRF